MTFESVGSLGSTQDVVARRLDANGTALGTDIQVNAYTTDEQFELSPEFRDDMFGGWSQGSLTSADAFYHYYSYFTRDQNYFETNLNRLKTPVTVIWGEKDFYINKEMGVEFANKAKVEITILSGIGHYPHLQSPKRTIDEIRASFGE